MKISFYMATLKPMSLGIFLNYVEYPDTATDVDYFSIGNKEQQQQK